MRRRYIQYTVQVLASGSGRYYAWHDVKEARSEKLETKKTDPTTSLELQLQLVQTRGYSSVQAATYRTRRHLVTERLSMV